MTNVDMLNAILLKETAKDVAKRLGEQASQLRKQATALDAQRLRLLEAVTGE